MPAEQNNFRNLNREGRWLDFLWQGLERRPGGSLQLCAVPALQGELPPELINLDSPPAPSGIAVDHHGNIYYTVPSSHRIWVVEGCHGGNGPMPCIGGEGNHAGRFLLPRGLWFSPARGALYVADRENHRVQIIDVESRQVVEIWGKSGPGGSPVADDDPGAFDKPWTLAGDDAGNVYVVDYGNRRVQKFGPAGDADPTFWQSVQSSAAGPLLTRPADIAVHSGESGTAVFILDQDSRTIFAIDDAGNPLLDSHGAPLAAASDSLQQPMGLAAGCNALYVGDNVHKTVFKFKRDDNYLLAGEAVGYLGPVASLALNRDNLLVHAGPKLPPVSLTIDAGRRSSGILWSCSIEVGLEKVNWHRLRAEIKPQAGSQFQFFIHTSEQSSPPPVQSGTDDPFPEPAWRPIAPDVADFHIGEPGCCVWIAGRFSGDGLSSPVLSQIRVEFDQETYVKHLPAIYQNRASCGDFLQRFLMLFESFFEEAEQQIAGLPRYFDPRAVPAEFLPWLAGWLALQLDEDWDEPRKRRAVAEAYARYARRGTAVGLRDQLRDDVGVNALIEEPLLNAGWWALPAKPETCCGCRGADWDEGRESILGFTTMLAPAEPQGAVVGTTAVLDQSHLVTGGEFGVPLFEDLAHRFSVQVYRGEIDRPGKRGEIETLIASGKPAHTDYHLCVIEPSMRVGFQSRLGIDTVIGGTEAPTPLGESERPDAALVLSGEPQPGIGKEMRVGKTTRL